MADAAFPVDAVVADCPTSVNDATDAFRDFDGSAAVVVGAVSSMDADEVGMSSGVIGCEMVVAAVPSSIDAAHRCFNTCLVTAVNSFFDDDDDERCRGGCSKTKYRWCGCRSKSRAYGSSDKSMSSRGARVAEFAGRIANDLL